MTYIYTVPTSDYNVTWDYGRMNITFSNNKHYQFLKKCFLNGKNPAIFFKNKNTTVYCVFDSYVFLDSNQSIYLYGAQDSGNWGNDIKSKVTPLYFQI